MKLYKSLTINKLDEATIQLGTPHLELIQKACTAFIQFLTPRISKEDIIICLCGTGNNGVDGLFIANKLCARGYRVEVLCLEAKIQLSKLYLEAKNIVLECGIPLKVIHPMAGIGEIEHADVIVDGIFGNGLNRPLSEQYVKIIENINKLNKRIYAIDIPSGMRAEGEIDDVILRCNATLAFQYPKLSFFQREAFEFLGKWECLSIGIPSILFKNEPSNQFLIDPKFIQSIFKIRKPHSHKGTFGSALLIGGSIGMAGAIILSAKTSLKIGAGKCTIMSISENREICQVSIPEASFKIMDSRIEDFSRYTIGIGPGLGKGTEAKDLLSTVVNDSSKPIVIDADALNLLAENDGLFSTIPQDSILTPHTGEFQTLFGNYNTDFQRFTAQLREAKERSIFIILKGRYTTIACPDGTFYFNSTGNPGMATGGSGDVLTGVITGLLAQGYSASEASILGVYLHGLSGDIATKSKGEMSLTASDIISKIPQAINGIKKNTK